MNEAVNRATSPVPASLVDAVHQALWGHFMHVEHQMFYDYWWDTPGFPWLPTADQIAREFPNAAGWGTGMENCALSAAQVLPWSIIPDAIEWDEWKTYERHEGMFYSLITLMGKIVNSVTVPLSLIVLEMTGYQAGTSVQPDSALMGIRLLIGPIPAVLLTGGIIFAIFYPLSRKQHRKIVEELRLRRKARREKSSPALGAAPIVSNK